MAKTHITDYLEFNARLKPDKPAIVTDERTLSWAELNNEVQRLALIIAGLNPPQDEQQVAAILMANNWQFVVTYLALLKNGYVVMPIDPTYKKLEIDAVIYQIDPVMIITDRDYEDSISRIVRPVYLFEELCEIPVARGRESGFLRLPADKQIATLVFTSGTTGQPKAATYSHTNHLWNIKVCSSVWNWNSDDTMLLSLPLSHWYGLTMGLSGIIYHGNTLYLQKWFDAKTTMEALASGKISMFTHVAMVYYKLMELGGKHDISKARLLISGGAPLPPAIWQAFKYRFGHEIIECYGSSESGRIASNRLRARKTGSPGRPLPEVDIKISDLGEVLVKSPGIFPGYWNNPEATAKALTEDGYWRTGDLGQLGNDGRIKLKGRLVERIRKFSVTISPRDVEWAMHQNPDISEIHVMGLQQADQINDVLVYFVVSSLNEEQIMDFCKANLPHAWRPDKIIKLAALPRTPNGKPWLSVMREMANQ